MTEPTLSRKESEIRNKGRYATRYNASYTKAYGSRYPLARETDSEEEDSWGGWKGKDDGKRRHPTDRDDKDEEETLESWKGDQASRDTENSRRHHQLCGSLPAWRHYAGWCGCQNWKSWDKDDKPSREYGEDTASKRDNKVNIVNPRNQHPTAIFQRRKS